MVSNLITFSGAGCSGPSPAFKIGKFVYCRFQHFPFLPKLNQTSELPRTADTILLFRILEHYRPIPHFNIRCEDVYKKNDRFLCGKWFKNSTNEPHWKAHC